MGLWWTVETGRLARTRSTLQLQRFAQLSSVQIVLSGIISRLFVASAVPCLTSLHHVPQLCALLLGLFCSLAESYTPL